MSPSQPKVHMNSGKKVNPIHSGAARHRKSSPQMFFATKMAPFEEKMNAILENTDDLQYLVKLSQLKLESSTAKMNNKRLVLKKRIGMRHKIISREKLNKSRLQDRYLVEAGNFCDPSDKMRRENLLKKAFKQGKGEIIRNMKEYENLRSEWLVVGTAYEQWLINNAESKRPDFMKNILLYRGRGTPEKPEPEPLANKITQPIQKTNTSTKQG